MTCRNTQVLVVRVHRVPSANWRLLAFTNLQFLFSKIISYFGNLSLYVYTSIYRSLNHLSRVMGNPAFRICEKRERCTAQLIGTFVFAI